jgi:two-component system phosphate regulon response regulator OmpR
MTQAAARTDKILVVDDDARIRDLLRRYLTQEGFEVILAEDGKALNRLMLRETADLIVLDLMMPGEDGLSICRRLRAANDRTPIIMLTAKGEDVDRIVGLEVGADDYLGKPFNPRELLARVHAVLRRRPAQEAPGAPSSDNEVSPSAPSPSTWRAHAAQERRGTAADHRRIRHAQGAGAPPAPAAVAREAGPAGPRPRVRALRPQPRRAGLAPAQADRADPASPRYIQTVWGVGYVFVPDGAG